MTLMEIRTNNVHIGRASLAEYFFQTNCCFVRACVVCIWTVYHHSTSPRRHAPLSSSKCSVYSIVSCNCCFRVTQLQVTRKMRLRESVSVKPAFVVMTSLFAAIDFPRRLDSRLYFTRWAPIRGEGAHRNYSLGLISVRRAECAVLMKMSSKCIVCFCVLVSICSLLCVVANTVRPSLVHNADI